MSFGDLTPEPSYAAGGDSMWGKLVPYSWQLLQDPAGDSPVPAAPRHWEAGSANTQIAWWSPLLHLLFYGLGWSRPDLGIATWISAGRPTDNNVLRLVDRWWGGRVEYLPAWSAQFPVLNDLGRKIHTVVADSCYNDARIQDRWEATRGNWMIISRYLAVVATQCTYQSLVVLRCGLTNRIRQVIAYCCRLGAITPVALH